jgi:transposase-like protein
MSVLSKPYFHDEAAAFEYLESVLWADGPVCQHCGALDRLTRVHGKTARAGLWRCGHCKRQFTVKIGTVFESAHIPLHKMLQAVYLLTSSKKGFSAHQLHRILGVTYKSAWFLAHRIREAMRSGDLAPFGGDGGAVEVDETFIGRKKGRPIRHGYEHKHKVLALVDRRTGKARSMVVDNLSTKTVAPIVRANVAKEARLMTDEARHYVKVRREFADHQRVYHSVGEYGRGEAHTNTIEGYFSIFKRGMKGVYQHCGEKHLHRYLAEFDFRYNERAGLGIDDATRAHRALSGVAGKRLTYRDS